MPFTLPSIGLKIIKLTLIYLNKFPNKPILFWLSFSEAELINAINKCNNSSTSGLNKLSWRHLKIIIKDSICLKKIVDIANACFELGHWPMHFKVSTSIIIPKPNKKLYNSPKAFRPIVLLNTIGKLIEKVMGERLMFQSISNNFIYSSQLGGFKQQLTIDTGITLMHFI